MLIGIIGLVLSVGISLAWYLPVVKAQKNKALTTGNYMLTAFAIGLPFTCGLIITTELIWDWLVGKTGLSGLAYELVSDIFRAALLEELFKFLGFFIAFRSIRPKRKIDYVLIAGLIGVMYSIVEKAVIGNIVAVIVGLAFPMHILWQFNQGGHFFEYEEAKKAGDRPRARKELFLSLLVPFLFHAAWDSLITVTAYLVEQENIVISIGGAVLGLLTLAGGVVYTVRTMKRLRRLAKDAPAVIPPEQSGTAGGAAGGA